MSVRMPTTRTGRVLTAVAAAAVLAATTAAVVPALSEDEEPSRCRDVRFEVTVAAVADEPQRVHGELCTPAGLDAGTPLQILLHGGTYDRSYWDWPGEGRSYVDAAVARGFATLNLDRLGYGESDRPDPERLDFAAGGEAVGQVVAAMRDGQAGTAFTTVFLNGHSMGGLVAEEAAALGGVDAVIVSGIAPDAGSGDGGGADPDAFYPAGQDPKFADEPWAEGYFTTKPGARPDAFLYPGTFDADVAEAEEELKDTLAVGELKSVRSDADEPEPRGDTSVPTAHVLGAHDVIACAEADCADSGADFVVPDSGHSVNLSHGAADFYEWTFDWLAKR